jgi:acetyltransferase-like isoleucine patch superfamily enzyme
LVNPLQYCHRIGMGLMSRARNIWYRALGVRITGYVWMRRISITRGWQNITIEAGSALDEGVSLQVAGDDRREKLVVGANTIIGKYTTVAAGERVEIGPNCLIGSHSFIADGIHGTAADQLVSVQPTLFKPVIIEQGVWVGAGCVVLAGVRLGKDCIVGAGSVVTKDIPPGMIAVGAPARVIKKRP